MASYLTKNRKGTYVFQMRVPKHIVHTYPDLKPTIWHSLRTKDRSEAEKRARRLWVMFDQLSERFNDPKVFGKAMELLKGYDDACKKGNYMEYIEDLDDTLEDGEYALFERVLSYRSEAKEQFQTESVTQQQIAQIIDAKLSGAKNSDPDFSKDNHHLSEMVEKYMVKQVDDGLAPGSRKPFLSKLTLFNSVLDALNAGKPVRLSDLDEDILRKYSEVIAKFPKDYKNQPVFKGKSISDVVHYISGKSREDLENEGVAILQGTKEILRLSRALLTFIEKKKYPLRPGLNSIIEDSTGNKKKSGKNKKVKLNAAYTQDELKAMFESDRFRHAKFKNAVDYWAPLIAIHTGATLAEICQLYISDIKNEGGIDVISINDDGDFKRLKNDDGRPRQVPIHPNLIKLDFLNFVESRREKGFERLFPEAERNAEDKYDSTGKRFATFRKSCGVTGAPREKTFHSFRTTVSVELLRNRGADEGLVNDIIGHASEYRESETKKTYGSGLTMPQVTLPWVKKINFGIDFKYPKKWRD
ncbi:DUF6538 domain-containing protein [Agaribacterium haliotis]|uniref:DUF6538 domain-containing protein n=1 Tax=Agaribacterium haliotis TaxID=2013869 RepID=UPI000BB59B0A